jgi:hypothetical protein
MSEQWTHTLSSFQEEFTLPYITLRFIAQLLWNGECRDKKGDVNALFHWCEMRHIDIEELNEFVAQNVMDVKTAGSCLHIDTLRSMKSDALAKEILASNSMVGTLKEMISQAKKPRKQPKAGAKTKRREAIAVLIETPEEAKKKAAKKAKGQANLAEKRAKKQKKQDRNDLSRAKSRGKKPTQKNNKKNKKK